jgi:hypothetical protein
MLVKNFSGTNKNNGWTSKSKKNVNARSRNDLKMRRMLTRHTNLTA